MFGSEGMDEFLLKAPGFMRSMKKRFDAYRGWDLSSKVVRNSIKEEAFEEVLEYLEDLGVPVNDEAVREMIGSSLDRVLCKVGLPETMLVVPPGLMPPPLFPDLNKMKSKDCNGDCNNCSKHE